MSSADEIELERSRFIDWVEKYQVFTTFSQDEFPLGGYDPQCVWTEFQNDDESFIDVGFTAYSDAHRMPVVGYYVSRIPAPGDRDDYEFVLTSMLLDCEACDAMGEDEDGEECPTCYGDRGTYFDFELPKYQLPAT